MRRLPKVDYLGSKTKKEKEKKIVYTDRYCILSASTIDFLRKFCSQIVHTTRFGIYAADAVRIVSNDSVYPNGIPKANEEIRLLPPTQRAETDKVTEAKARRKKKLKKEKKDEEENENKLNAM